MDPTQSKHFPHRHLLSIQALAPQDITGLLDLADFYVELNRKPEKKIARLRGRTLINLFFESSTRTRTSFELAGKRLGADVINMSIEGSSIKKGETLIDTAMTLNAMHPDLMVVRHGDSGAVAPVTILPPQVVTTDNVDQFMNTYSEFGISMEE